MSFLSYLINGISLGSVYAIIALGYTMVYGIARMLNFAHGDIIMVGGFTVFTIVTTMGGSPVVGILASVVVCTVLGVTIERVAYRPLRDASPLAVLITAIGVSYLLQNVALLIFGSNARQFTSVITVPALKLAGGKLSISSVTIVTILSCIVIMAALMTSVIDNSTKVAEYIQVCRQMGIAVLPPNVNDGYAGFSVSGKDIRYGLSAIKSIGRPVIDALVQERTENGRFKSLKDFIDRMSGREMNRRAVENFIKGGAFDDLGGTRKQFMQVYGKLMDQITNDRKTTMAGQMSLFDMVAPEEKKQFEIRLPDCGEFSREEMLAMEKEVLGIYVSGHPLQEYEAKWRKNITKTTGDFVLDEESGTARGITDDEKAMIGGIITAKNVKYTKQNKAMAFLTVEDLYGSVEVIVFPREYERYHLLMQEEQKVFIRGRVSAEEDKNGKLICEKIYSFDDARRELWIQFADRETFEQQENETLALLSGSDGQDQVVIYLAKEHAMKRLGANMTVFANNELVNELNKKLGEKNIKVLEKSIEKM